MRYRVISSFRDLKTGLYVSEGAKCPPITAETAARLIKARCIVEITDSDPRAPAAPSAAEATTGDPTPPAPPPSAPPARSGRRRGRRAARDAAKE
jgi:hypothetical protein